MIRKNEASLAELPGRASDGGLDAMAAAAALVAPWKVGADVALGWRLRRIADAQEGVRYIVVPRAGSGVCHRRLRTVENTSDLQSRTVRERPQRSATD